MHYSIPPLRNARIPSTRPHYDVRPGVKLLICKGALDAEKQKRQAETAGKIAIIDKLPNVGWVCEVTDRNTIILEDYEFEIPQ